jgi:hypothetical protein
MDYLKACSYIFMGGAMSWVLLQGKRLLSTVFVSSLFCSVKHVHVVREKPGFDVRSYRQ